MQIQIAPPSRTGSLVADTGRRIGWSEWGPREGAPVLFCTGAGMSSTLGFGADVVDALGVRLLCIDRAGLGASDPDPDKSFASWTRDVAAVLASEGVAEPACVGFSQGAPFAVALAGAGILRRLALVAGQDELADLRIRAMLPAQILEMLDAVASDRDAFEHAFATRVDAEGLWSLVIGMSAPLDRAIYAQPAFTAAYRASLREGFASGPAGYVRDLTLALSPWPVPPESIEVPVDLWYGALDESPVHSPDHGATLASRFPRAIRHLLDDEGGSLLWTRAREILEALLR